MVVRLSWLPNCLSVPVSGRRAYVIRALLFFFPSSYSLYQAFWLYSQLAKGSRHKITWLSYTYISLMNKLSRRAYYHLWHSKSSPLSSSLCLLYCSFPFSLFLPAAESSGTMYDTLWHGSLGKLCFASVALSVPKSRTSIRKRDESRWMACLGVRGTRAFVHSFTSDFPAAAVQKYTVIRTRDPQSECENAHL